jgi:hypothetical protein
MTTLTLYLFESSMLNFKRQQLNVCGLSGVTKTIQVTGWLANTGAVSLSTILLDVMPKLKDLEDHVFEIVVPKTDKVLLKALASEDLGKTIAALNKAENIDSVVKANIIELMNLINELGLKVGARSYTTEKEDFSGSVTATAACDCGLVQHGLGNTGMVTLVENIKNLNKKVYSRDPMLFDNNLIDLGTDFRDAVFTGIGDVKKRAPKKDNNLDEVFTKASHVHFLGNNSRLRNYGMYSSGERYHVLIPKFIDYQRKINGTIANYPLGSAIRLKEMMSPNINSLVSNDDFSRLGISPQGDLYTNRGKLADVSYVFNPPRLFYKVKAAYLSAYERLVMDMNAISTVTPNGKHIVMESADVYLTDITDTFYITDDAGKFIFNPERDTSELITKFSDVVYDSGVFNCMLMYQTTMPTYAEFKRLLKLNPKIYIEARRRETHVIELAVIIQTDLGTCRYHCPHGGIKVLKKASKAARK